MRTLYFDEMEMISGGSLDDIVGGAAASEGGAAAASIATAAFEGAEFGSVAGPLGTLFGAAIGIGIAVLWVNSSPV